MNLILIREIITNTTSYPIVLTFHIFSFFTSYKMRVLLGGITFFICLYNYYNITDIDKTDKYEYLLENNHNNTIS